MTQSALDTPPTQNPAPERCTMPSIGENITACIWGMLWLPLWVCCPRVCWWGGRCADCVRAGNNGNSSQPPAPRPVRGCPGNNSGRENISLHGHWLGLSHHHNSSLITRPPRLCFLKLHRAMHQSSIPISAHPHAHRAWSASIRASVPRT